MNTCISHPTPLGSRRYFRLQPLSARIWLALSTSLMSGLSAAACYNDNQLETIIALNSLFTNSAQFRSAVGNPDINTFSDLLPVNPLNPTAAGPCDTTIVETLTPDQITAMGSMATRINGGKISQPYNYFGLNQKKRGGGGAGDDDFPNLSFWAKIDSDFGSRNASFSQPGFAFDNHNFVFGADYRLRDNWIAGGSFSYRHNTADFNAGRGQTVNDSYTGMFYTTYHITDAAHVEATASYGGFTYDTTRNINLFGQRSIAKASPDGGQYAFSWGGGYDFNWQALTIGPYVRGEYSNLDIDAYSESGSILAVRFGKQSIESLTSTLGVQTSYVFSFPWGVLIPQLRGEWHHQFKDGQRLIQAGFIADPTGRSFVMTSDGPSRDYYTFGAEVSSVFPGGLSAFLAYETLQGYTSIDSNKLMLGARLEF
jgi:outer membrane lipase/esterase